MHIEPLILPIIPLPRRGRRYGITMTDRRLEPIIRSLYDQARLTDEQYATALAIQELYRADGLLARWPFIVQRLGPQVASILSSIVLFEESPRSVGRYWGCNALAMLRVALDTVSAIRWRQGW